MTVVDGVVGMMMIEWVGMRMMTVVDGVVRMMIEWVGMRMRMGWMGLVEWVGMMIGRIESPSGQTGWMVGMMLVMISMISRMTIVMMMTLLLIVQSIV